tara:strand:- start:79 stop:435 length:357 start_codon:yes stop_codon:yes gene_type:complete
MALSYKIRTFDTASGSILISVHNAGGTEVGAVNIDLPMDEGSLYLVGTPLDDYIKGFIPEGHFTRLDTVGGGVANASAITALLQPYPAVEAPSDEEIADQAEATIAAIDARLTHHSLI